MSKNNSKLIVVLGIIIFSTLYVYLVVLYPVINIDGFKDNTEIFTGIKSESSTKDDSSGVNNNIIKKVEKDSYKMSSEEKYKGDHLNANLALLWMLLNLLILIIIISIVYLFYRDWELRKEFLVEDMYKNVHFKYFLATIKDLELNIIKYNVIGVISLAITVFGLIIFSVFVFGLFTNTFKDIEDINRSGNNTALIIIILLLRTSLLGTLIISFIVYSFKFSNASFDQAVRFNKRKQASLFLLNLFGNKTSGKSSLKEIMAAFKEWNVGVETAYTNIKMDSKMAKTMFDRMKNAEDLIKDLMPSKKEPEPTPTPPVPDQASDEEDEQN
jgi:hypothetical protein